MIANAAATAVEFAITITITIIITIIMIIIITIIIIIIIIIIALQRSSSPYVLNTCGIKLAAIVGQHNKTDLDLRCQLDGTQQGLGFKY